MPEWVLSKYLSTIVNVLCSHQQLSTRTKKVSACDIQDAGLNLHSQEVKVHLPVTLTSLHNLPSGTEPAAQSLGNLSCSTLCIPQGSGMIGMRIFLLTPSMIWPLHCKP